MVFAFNRTTNSPIQFVYILSKTGYILNDGRIQTRSSVARFSGNGTGLNEPFVLYPGDYDLTMELFKNKNGTYVRIE